MSINKGLDTDVVVAKFHQVGTVAETARFFDAHPNAIRYHLQKAGVKKPVVSGRKAKTVEEQRAPLPKTGVSRYLLTCAQNNTKVNSEFIDNLEALAAHYGAKIKVSRITYNASAYTAQPAKPGSTTNATDELWYDPRIVPYLDDTRTELAPGLVWCGETNILPTAERPLRGFETYTGRKSGIFPHTKMAMDSVASGKHEPTKFNYTTGTCTQMSYIQRKAGQKAEHHHTYGALLVEVDAQGRWFVRQINAERSGRFYDVTLCVDKGNVTDGHQVEGINWGDIHEDQMEQMVRDLAFGKGGMLDVLRPKYQFMHDVLSWSRRNHHDRKDPHKSFELHIKGQEAVQEEVQGVSDFLSTESYRKWCETVVVDSNHDRAMSQWLREADYKTDPVNAIYFLRCQLRKYESIAERDDNFHLVEWACQQEGTPESVRFLREDESFIICADAHGGIECGMHGHNGVDGARGSPLGFARMGRKSNTGHTHKAGILDGCYTAGTSSMMDLGYNRGPGSWSWSHIVTYANGKRAIYTMWNEAWRAEG